MENQQVFEEATDPKKIKSWLRWFRKLGAEAALERIRKENRSNHWRRFFNRREFWLWFVTTLVVVAMVIFFLGKF